LPTLPPILLRSSIRLKTKAWFRLDHEHCSAHGAAKRGEARMASKACTGIFTLAVMLLAAGCNGTRSTECRCPKPIAYDEPTLKKISQALRALPADNVLHQAMEDYENERDDLRFCP
jgi:hypothetical protein